MYDIFYLGDKETDHFLSIKKQFPRITLTKTLNIKEIQNKSFTKMFWIIWSDIVLNEKFDLNSYRATKWDDCYVHIFKNGDFFDGICLIPKNIDITQKEFDYRFFTEKKEVDIVASIPKEYDRFIIDTYEDYLAACESSTTKMFWMIPKEVEILDFKFDLYFSHHNSYDRNMNHVFQHKFNNKLTYNGISCIPNNKKLSKKEIDFRFLIEKKQYEVVASKLKPYDIIFISYNEPNADKNYTNLKNKFSRAKRIHGIKGIHNAHKEAAKISDTDMFYVVDGDAEIVDDFNFDYEVSRYERDIVFVWQSINPINDLIYGYGGVKLLPKKLVLEMDIDTVDMTMSISNKLKVVESISNKTRFDTDEFSTWKSAFRESVKLASRPIDEIHDEQTDFRLQTWCSKGADRKFGQYSIDGSKAGREYGYDNIGNNEALMKINDFEWLKTYFLKYCDAQSI